MKNRSPLEDDLQLYKNKYQVYEQILKDQQAISNELLQSISRSAETGSTDEFQQRLNLNNKNIEVSTRALGEIRNEINEIEFLLKDRNTHIKDFLQYLNEGREEIPESWLKEFRGQQEIDLIQYYIPLSNKLYWNLMKQKENKTAEYIRIMRKLFSISEITTRLALRKKRIDDNNISIVNIGSYLIENSNASMTLMTCIEVGRSDAFIMTEYCMDNIKYAKVIINLVSDRCVYRNQFASNIFSPEEILIEESRLDRSDLCESYKNQVALKVIINCLDCLEGECKDDIYHMVSVIFNLIEEYSLLKSVNHSDWLLLHNTLASFIWKIQRLTTISRDKFNPIFVFLESTKEQVRNFFFQQAQSHFIRIFSAKVLSTGLSEIKKHLIINNLSAENFIEFCQKKIAERGASSVGRSQQTSELYQAMLKIRFIINDRLEIDCSCLNRLENAVENYLNPPKTQLQLETELKQYEYEYNECQISIQKMASPIHDARKFLHEKFKGVQAISFGILNDRLNQIRGALNNLQKQVESGIINLVSDPDHLVIDLINHELTMHRSMNVYLLFYDVKMYIDIYTLIIKDEDAKEDIDTRFDGELDLFLLDQKLSLHLDNQGINITIENHNGDASSGNHQVKFLIEDELIRIDFINQNQSDVDHALAEFSRRFNDKIFIHKLGHRMASIDKISGLIRKYLEFANQNVLYDFIRRFPGEKLASMIDSHGFILERIDRIKQLLAGAEAGCLEDIDYAAISEQSYVISHFFSAIKPHLEKIKQYYSDVFDWAMDNTSDTISFFAYKTIALIVMNLVISKCDEFQFISLQNRIDEKIRQLRDLETKISSCKQAMQNQNSLAKARPSSASMFTSGVTVSKSAEEPKLALGKHL